MVCSCTQSTRIVRLSLSVVTACSTLKFMSSSPSSQLFFIDSRKQVQFLLAPESLISMHAGMDYCQRSCSLTSLTIIIMVTPDQKGTKIKNYELTIVNNILILWHKETFYEMVRHAFVAFNFSCKPGQQHLHKLDIAQYGFVLLTWRDMV